MRAIKEGNIELPTFMAALKQLGGRGAMGIVGASKKGIDSLFGAGGEVTPEQLKHDEELQKKLQPAKVANGIC
jgi:hypothetical protein